VQAPGFFGEMGLMTGAPRTADVVACTDIECYRLDKEGFEKIVTGRPAALDELSDTLAKRKMTIIASDEELDASAKTARQAEEKAAILNRIEVFFGLKS
jgi:CRP-like cAMP-binding protein